MKQKKLSSAAGVVLATLAATGALGHPAHADAEIAPSVSGAHAQLADRIERARELLMPAVPDAPAVQDATRLAQWFNWPNWRNYWRNF